MKQGKDELPNYGGKNTNPFMSIGNSLTMCMCTCVFNVFVSSRTVKKYCHGKMHFSVRITQSHFKITTVNMLENNIEDKYKCQVTSEQQNNRQNTICKVFS